MFDGLYRALPFGLQNGMRPLTQNRAVCLVDGPIALLTTIGAVIGDPACATRSSFR